LLPAKGNDGVGRDRVLCGEAECETGEKKDPRPDRNRILGLRSEEKKP